MLLEAQHLVDGFVGVPMNDTFNKTKDECKGVTKSKIRGMASRYFAPTRQSELENQLDDGTPHSPRLVVSSSVDKMFEIYLCVYFYVFI